MTERLERDSRDQHARRRIVAVVAMLATLAGLVVPTAPAAAQSDEISVVVTGRGWGHGRGMGQYGSLGYAQAGQVAEWILDHFYGGTSAGLVTDLDRSLNSLAPDPDAVRVELRYNRSEPLRVDFGNGGIRVIDLNTGQRAVDNWGNPMADLTGAVRVFSSGTEVVVQLADACNSSFAEIARIPAGADAAGVELQPIATGGALLPQDELLRVCRPDGNSSWYEGTLRGINVSGSTRAVNVVPLDAYLRGVVPNEVPAGWPAEALEVQSVAARSYVVAGDTRQQPYADTCETTLCQVYDGRFFTTGQPLPGTKVATAQDHPATNAAIAATTGVVRLHADGRVARTEFSSSTGGYTAGGDFPAVPDDGDSVSTNPNHQWSVVVNLTSFEASSGLGRLLSVEETRRNGYGNGGGRVLEVVFTFEDGTRTLSGNDVRRTFGLKSDWFDFGPLEHLVATGAVDYIDHVFEIFLGRPAQGAEHSQWAEAVGSGQYHLLTEELATSDEWAGVMIDDLYRSALGRAADAGGRAHWLAQVADGARIADIGTEFYGSPEYYRSTGSSPEEFVAQLYLDLQERPADQSGLAHWVDQLDAGTLTRSQVAAAFYASPESRERRVTQLYQSILGRNPDPGGLAFWADRLLTEDDVRLAVQLASSTEVYTISQAG